MHLVFVFGTLKEGFPNFKSNKGIRVPGTFATKEKYPLYLVGERRSPCLVMRAGEGKRVTGQVFAVDDFALSEMDLLERVSYPDGHMRVELQVTDMCGENEMQVFAYMTPAGQLSDASIMEGPLVTYELEHAAVYRNRT